ncbi:MAG TPA: YqgE/AlgH family protein [Thermoanaerobaculia bacterium]|nr:YqgE/AlgH family protein [Thermoanaerobaculia bacterium]
MADITETVETPLLLVAMPQVTDPFFHRSVVLLLEHDGEGSFGLILNRPTELTLAELLSGLGVEWGGAPAATSWLGGPVQPNIGTLLWGGAAPPGGGEGVLEFAPGVKITRDVRVLSRVAAEPPERFRLLLGCAGWGAGQLEQEIARNDWLIAPFDADGAFDAPAGEMWERALRSIGVRPESLPSWTMPSEGDGNN